MDRPVFDRVSRLLAQNRLSRRTALGGVAAGAALGLSGLRAAQAQESTPGATPAADMPVVDGGGKNPEIDPTFMFVQSFQSGTATPVDGSSDTFTLTLQHGGGQTVYFSDRPERSFGAVSTPGFLDGLPFGADNPPNAALVMQVSDDDTDVAVVELTDPAFSEADSTVTYTAKVLADYPNFNDTSFQTDPTDATSLVTSFNGASLFIDDCPDTSIWCFTKNNELICRPEGLINNVGMCWQWGCLCCSLCAGDPTAVCNSPNSPFPNCANENCIGMTQEEENRACGGG